ncbi:MAG: hypothetical protein AB1664_12445 [Thermodesulfobacteriota bacterium]
MSDLRDVGSALCSVITELTRATEQASNTNTRLTWVLIGVTVVGVLVAVLVAGPGPFIAWAKVFGLMQ